MQNAEILNTETLTTEDMMRIFGLSRNSIYRRHREAREGRGGLPLAIETGAKRGLRWSAEAVKNFLQNANRATTKHSDLDFESAAKRAARNRAALKKLEKFGIKITGKGEG